jgi:DtxR family Mn-dependent transcriptional regulator
MMDDLELTDAAEEILASLWPEPEARGSACAFDPHGSERAALEELQAQGLVEANGDALSLTAPGLTAAAGTVRRERLAERLLADVLNVSDALATETACKFEHLLRRGIDDEICTLLGHPRVCPHGSAIPPGPCCETGAEAADRVVSSLANLSPGQSGVIAYLQSGRREIMQRLLAMGAIPGAPVTLRQRFPSLVFALGHTEIAIDEETARDIYVRLTTAHKPERQSRLRLGFRRRRGGR